MKEYGNWREIQALTVQNPAVVINSAVAYSTQTPCATNSITMEDGSCVSCGKCKLSVGNVQCVPEEASATCDGYGNEIVVTPTYTNVYPQESYYNTYQNQWNGYGQTYTRADGATVTYSQPTYTTYTPTTPYNYYYGDYYQAPPVTSTTPVWQPPATTTTSTTPVWTPPTTTAYTAPSWQPTSGAVSYTAPDGSVRSYSNYPTYTVPSYTSTYNPYNSYYGGTPIVGQRQPYQYTDSYGNVRWAVSLLDEIDLPDEEEAAVEEDVAGEEEP